MMHCKHNPNFLQNWHPPACGSVEEHKYYTVSQNMLANYGT